MKPSNTLPRALPRIAALLGGAAGNALIAFLTQVALTHGMAIADYGLFAAILAVVGLLAPVAGIASGWFWLELHGREGAAARRWSRAARRLTVWALALCFGGLGLYLWGVCGGRTAGWSGAWSAACVMLLAQTAVEAKMVLLQLEERFFVLAAWQVIPQLFRAAAVAALAWLGVLSAPSVLAAYAAAAIVVAALSLPSLRRLTAGLSRLPVHPVGMPPASFPREPDMLACARAAAPYVLVTLFYLAVTSGIVVLVERVLDPASAAFYNVGYLVYAAVALAPSVIYTKYMAGKLLRWWTHDRAMFVAAFHLGLAAHLALGIVLGTAVWLAAPWMIPRLFGQRYAPAIPVLQTLAFALPLRFAQHGYGSVLFAKEHVMRKVGYMGSGALAGALLVLVLAPRFGIGGAAVAAVLAESVLLILYMYGAIRHVDGIDVAQTFRWSTLTAARRLAIMRSREEPSS